MESLTRHRLHGTDLVAKITHQFAHIRREVIHLAAALAAWMALVVGGLLAALWHARTALRTGGRAGKGRVISAIYGDVTTKTNKKVRSCTIAPTIGLAII